MEALKRIRGIVKQEPDAADCEDIVEIIWLHNPSSSPSFLSVLALTTGLLAWGKDDAVR